MPIIHKISQKQIDKLYFCPYCRVLFLENSEYQKCESDLDEAREYKCFDCKKYFDVETYKEEARCGQNYHFKNNHTEGDSDLHIQNIILSFYQEGKSQRDIHKLTFFSRTKIAKIIKVAKSELPLNLIDFFQEYLGLTEDDYEAIMYDHSMPDTYKYSKQDIRAVAIGKALDFGFTIEQIAKLFRVSNTTIYNIRKKDHKKRQRKNKISLLGKGETSKIVLLQI